jgi:PAS domain S-box-containing protein
LNTTVPPAPAYPELGAVIGRIQSRFSRAEPTADVFGAVLADLLQLTHSQSGFIANVVNDPADGHRFARFLAVRESAAGPRPRVPRGGQAGELHDLAALFGAVLENAQPVIANDARNDPRAAGLAPVDCYLGVPLLYRGRMVGLVGLADRANGYDQALVDGLAPLFANLAAVVHAVHLEEALHDSEERLRTTFDMAAVGIAHITPDGRFVRANQRLCEVVGYSLEELLTLRVQDLTLPEDLNANLEYASHLLRGGAPGRTLERRYRRRDGAVIWLSYKAALVSDADGRPSYFIAVMEDVTERKRTEEVLLAAQAAERANAAKTEFLSRMSHELRTPLNAVLGFAQLLQMDADHPLTSEQKTQLQHIEDAGAHLLAMINDVLDLSRIESGGMTLAPQRVALSSAVPEAVALVATAARDATVQIKVEPPPGDAPRADGVRADHLRLRQVLVNLLSNAIKYNRPHGSVTVSWRATPDGNAVQLQVSDTGQGLTAEQRAHLFEPFNRLGAEHTRVEGTGIGLVVTQRLVQLMGGTIAAESEAGLGSRFTVTLPAAAGVGSELPAAAPLDPAWRDGTADGPRRTVLYAEDNAMNLELVRRVMQLRPDWRLVVARNGREAIRLAHEERPDLMLLDMHLGDMTGVEVAEQLAGDPRLHAVPRIALSADAMPAAIEEARRAGFQGYLTKPLDVPTFLRCLNEALAGAPKPD